MKIEISKVALAPLTTGNDQSPDTRTMHYETHGNVKLHVCNEELWRFERIKRDIDSGRYANLKLADILAFKKQKRKYKKRK